MSEPESDLWRDEAIERDAARWVLRRDRGFSPACQDEFSQWLAADPRHRAVYARQCWGWDELDRLAGLNTVLLSAGAPDPDLLAPSAENSGLRRWLLWPRQGLLF